MKLVFCLQNPIDFIGVTTADPDTLEEVPDLAWPVPETWGLDLCKGQRFEKSREVDTGKVTKVTQQEGDVWGLEVTPGGQVYIYHNYNQPWGSPAFTLPHQTTLAWVILTLDHTTVSLLQTSDTGEFMSLFSLDNLVILYAK